jgi:serine/threonine-protein kinase
LAPEQARGEVADPGTDVYSLAVVLWELLTGHQYLQISGLDPAAALSMVRHPKPAPPSSRAPWVTPALDSVLMQALAPDRTKRFATAEEFRLALSEAIAEAAPRTDAARVSELMHAIYAKAIAEEAAERERFMKEVLPAFRASVTPVPVEESGRRSTETARAPEVHPQRAAAAQARKLAKRAAAMQVLAELEREDAAAESSK